MNWLTKAFADSARNSWLAKYVPSEKIPSVLHLLDQKEAVLELHDIEQSELETYFQAALAYRNNSTEYRQSIATLSSRQSSARSSTFSALPESQRDSLASDITTFSNASARSPRIAYDASIGQDGLRNSLPIHVNGSSGSRVSPFQPRGRSLLSREKKFWCPNCPGKGANRPADLLKHLKNFCEKPQKGFKCRDCNVVEKEEGDIQEHGRVNDHGYTSDFDLPAKKAFGCPFCGSYQQSLETYARCLCKDQEENSSMQARPSLRVRGLLHQDAIKQALVLQCQRRGLDPDAWTSLVWDDVSSARFADRLEYGCNADDASCGPGVGNVEQFVETMLISAKFEVTKKPVPPVNVLIEAEPPAMESYSAVALNSFQSTVEPTQNFQLPWSDCLDFSLSEFPPATQGDIQRRTAMALQSTQPEYPPWTTLQNKRPPSTHSSSLEDARSRSRRPPTSHKLTPSTAEEYIFPPQLMDPALSSFREALQERGYVAQPTSSYTPSAPQALLMPPSLCTAQNTQFQNIFNDESYDDYER